MTASFVDAIVLGALGAASMQISNTVRRRRARRKAANDPLHVRLMAFAKREGVSMNNATRLLVEQALDAQERVELSGAHRDSPRKGKKYIRRAPAAHRFWGTRSWTTRATSKGSVAPNKGREGSYPISATTKEG